MPLFLSPVSKGLAWLGRHGAAGFAVSIFLGLALPWLASSFRPFLPASIFLFVTLSFARADFAGVRRVMRRPAMMAATSVWMVLAMPALIGIGLAAIGRGAVEPGLLLGIALVAAAPPLMGFPAYAALLGLDNSLGIALLVITLAVTPFVAPPLASFVAGSAVPIDSVVLGVRLFGLLAGAGGAALLLRRIAGPERLAAARHQLDGVFVLIYFFFAIAAMDGVIGQTLADPLRTVLYLAVGSGLALLGLGAAMLALRSLGAGEAFVLGLGTGMRNTGLLVGAMGAACPPDTYLFFALLQFPIYLAPFVMAPLALVVARRAAQAKG
ncbi:hypothetical protein NK718_17995 [Alsobacter sp. SYSU M60028]|uniref:Na+-dependent transporter n=1 Tax=Alsobacter ponti TaxID=2962936 RepID=A0ABT1LH53_9HYPH|nr:hypothetical protein [Alsobacter ponti]MCP8940421.1 hypothetical protein [Alsobacter ponti]